MKWAGHVTSNVEMTHTTVSSENLKSKIRYRVILKWILMKYGDGVHCIQLAQHSHVQATSGQSLCCYVGRGCHGRAG
jgi:hypothetical protein